MHFLDKQKLRHFYQSSTVRVISALAGSQIALAVVGAIGALVQGRFVTPEELGYFRQFSIVAGYISFLNLGVFHALERSYPYYIGCGETKKAIEMVQVTRAWIIIVTMPICLVFAILAGYEYLIGHNWRGALGWLSQVALVVATLYGGYLAAVYRSGMDFQKLAKAQIWGAPISLITLPLFWVQPYFALFLRSVVGISVTTWQLFHNCPIRVTWRFSWREWISIIKQGLPRFSASYISTTGLDTVMISLIAIKLGKSSLGYWSFSGMLVAMMQQIPQALTAVYAPRIAELYGRTRSVTQCILLCRKPTLYGLCFALVAALCGVVGVYLLFPIVFPKYAPATNLICLLLMMLPFKVLENPANIFNAMNWVFFMNMRAIASTLTQVAFLGVGFWLGWGLYSLVVGILSGNIVRTLLLVFGLKYAMRLESEGAFGGGHEI